MLKTILVAVDGSEVGKKALECALALAKILDADLHAIYVIQVGLYPSLTMNDMEPVAVAQQAVYEMLEREAEDILADAVDTAAAAGVRITPEKRFGQPGPEIVGLATELEADLIILGSHGRSRLDQLFLGSVSLFVLHHSPIATMITRA